ncbi:hypothetical protein Micbo1qcDRAFT_167307, partial [Microdochium bolleyi]
MYANKDCEKLLENWSRQVMCDACGLLTIKDSQCQGCLQQGGSSDNGIAGGQQQEIEDPAKHDSVSDMDTVHDARQPHSGILTTPGGPRFISHLQGIWAVRATAKARKDVSQPWVHTPRLRKIKAERQPRLATQNSAAMQSGMHHMGLATY